MTEGKYKQKTQKKCKFEKLDKPDWGWCKTHNVGYNPLLWHGGEKFCPDACQCFSCDILHRLLNAIHWDTSNQADKKTLKAINEIFKSWGINVDN